MTAELNGTKAFETAPVNTEEVENTLSADELKKHSAAAKAFAASFGEATAIFARSPEFKHLTIADLPKIIAPALARGQFAIANAQEKRSGAVTPVAFVSWASVSTELDQKFAEIGQPPPRPTDKEWSCGDNIWIVDAVGAPRAVGELLKSVASARLTGRIIKYKTREGKPEVLQI
jgi:hemolysin-activating ACP:hemolysin acyltransferase